MTTRRRLLPAAEANAAPALLTEDEAAQALKVCARTLRKARQDGKLTYVLIGRAVRYTSSDLEAFVAISRQDHQQAPKRRAPSARPSAKIVPFSARQ